MTINRPMFAEIHKMIVQFPELHEQSSWETDPEDTGKCGTTRCVAGWATWLGASTMGLLSRKREFTDGRVRRTMAIRLGIEDGDLRGYLSDYSPDDYPVLGATLLGLSEDQASSLFHDFNHERVVARVKSFAETGEDISEEEFERFYD